MMMVPQKSAAHVASASPSPSRGAQPPVRWGGEQAGTLRMPFAGRARGVAGSGGRESERVRWRERRWSGDGLALSRCVKRGPTLSGTAGAIWYRSS